jgi:MFS-type transporter involved in bile tolerance (Atg22 family)
MGECEVAKSTNLLLVVLLLAAIIGWACDYWNMRRWRKRAFHAVGGEEPK